MASLIEYVYYYYYYHEGDINIAVSTYFFDDLTNHIGFA